MGQNAANPGKDVVLAFVEATDAWSIEIEMICYAWTFRYSSPTSWNFNLICIDLKNFINGY